MKRSSTPDSVFSWLLLAAAMIGASRTAVAGGTVTGWGRQVVLAAPLTDVRAIAAGSYHSLALKSDGTVAGWGLNDDGQATPPAGLSGAVAISAGLYHSVALAGTPSAPCLVDMRLSYSPGALSVTQAIGSAATRNVYASVLVSKGGVTQLAPPRGLPAMAPPRLFPISVPVGSIGTVGVFGVLKSLDDPWVCYDFATIDTGR